MTYELKKHHRRSIRLREWNYSRSGAYFVTVCTQDRKCLFGDIINAEIVLNESGKMIWKWWNEVNNKFQYVQTDEVIVMPNHFHGIIFIDENTSVGAALCGRPIEHQQPDQIKGQPHRVAPTSLFDIMDWFKTMTTNGYIQGVKKYKWEPFPGKLWQRNYFDRIIRNETELNKIREYILNNPLKWELDKENPMNWEQEI